MASRWTNNDTAQGQIDSTIEDAITRVRSQLPHGEGLAHCEECDMTIPEARYRVIPGARLCVNCQVGCDREQAKFNGHNRHGSKDSQLR